MLCAILMLLVGVACCYDMLMLRVNFVLIFIFNIRGARSASTFVTFKEVAVEKKIFEGEDEKKAGGGGGD